MGDEQDDEDEDDQGREKKPDEKKVVWDDVGELDAKMFNSGEAGEGEGDFCDFVSNFARNNEDSSGSEKPTEDIILETIEFSADEDHHITSLRAPRKIEVQKESVSNAIEDPGLEMTRVNQMVLEDADESEMIEKIERKVEEVATGTSLRQILDKRCFLEEVDDTDISIRGAVGESAESKQFGGVSRTAAKKVKEESIFRFCDRDDDSNINDNDDLYTSWKREMSLCEKWQEGGGKGEREKIDQTTGNGVSVKEEAVIVDRNKEEIDELGEASIKESMLELGAEMKDLMGEKEEEDVFEEEVEKMLKEDMAMENVLKVREIKVGTNVNRVDTKLLEDEMLGDDLLLGRTQMKRTRDEADFLVQCCYCKQKEDVVRILSYITIDI